MRANEIPILKIHIKDKGSNQKIYEFRPFLFKGGSQAKKFTYDNIKPSRAELRTISERYPLVKKLYDHFTSQVVGGTSDSTIRGRFLALQSLYIWADSRDFALTHKNLETNFILWVDHLIARYLNNEIKHKTAYDLAHQAARVLSRALNLGPSLNRNIKIPIPQKNPFEKSAEIERAQENLTTFGQLLRQLAEPLTLQVIRGPLPVEIQVLGNSFYLPYLKELSTLKSQGPGSAPRERNPVLKRRAEVEAGAPLKNRRSVLVNLKIEAELLIFISQTGMNLSQAYYLKTTDFKFMPSKGDTATIKIFKARRGGETIYRIFPKYLSHLKEYLTWRNGLTCKTDELVFPFHKRAGGNRGTPKTAFQHIRIICRKLNVNYIPPTLLRKLRTSWFFERGHDPKLISEVNQHTEDVLYRHYKIPSYKTATQEISKFHERYDPTNPTPAPGICASVEQYPELITGSQPNAPVPDCSNPGGCMFCIHHRDVNSQDYIFALVSYRLCKQLELDSYCPPSHPIFHHPAKALLDRIDQKIQDFRVRGEIQDQWAAEATDQTREGIYHPAFDGFIKLLEVAK